MKLRKDIVSELDYVIKRHKKDLPKMPEEELRNFVLYWSLRFFNIAFPKEKKPKEIRKFIEEGLAKLKREEAKEIFRLMGERDKERGFSANLDPEYRDKFFRKQGKGN